MRSEELFIQSITLTNFRNYKTLRMNLSKEPVILIGENGSGKTNILEAVSLLSPGKGLRRAALTELQNKDTVFPWGVASEIYSKDEVLKISTGIEPKYLSEKDSQPDKRLILLDGKPLKNQTELSEHIAVSWIIPEMDRLLSQGAGLRRKFLDKLAYTFAPSHGGRVSSYEKAMRERNILLQNNRPDAKWLAALENEMAQKSVAIAATRLHMENSLQAVVNESTDAFPKADIVVAGFAEDALRNSPALLVEDALRAALEKSRTEDREKGTAALGAHKSDLKVFYRDKSCLADLCSTGEQKALIVSIMLSFVRLIEQLRGFPPIFLLDDIAAHLDEYRREALFEAVFDIGTQAWISGTEKNFFQSMFGKAQLFKVENGEWEMEN
ncbi:MAG: DNA replication/repair protein RecF [Alphaproteobacteria bacterium]|nr:DNA replication/repair protein RecF [Alphaproteobacteria bacterium]